MFPYAIQIYDSVSNVEFFCCCCFQTHFLFYKIRFTILCATTTETQLIIIHTRQMYAQARHTYRALRMGTKNITCYCMELIYMGGLVVQPARQWSSVNWENLLRWLSHLCVSSGRQCIFSPYDPLERKNEECVKLESLFTCSWIEILSIIFGIPNISVNFDRDLHSPVADKQIHTNDISANKTTNRHNPVVSKIPVRLSTVANSRPKRTM